MVISYRGSRNWAFRDRPPVHADGGRTAFVVSTWHDVAPDRVPGDQPQPARPGRPVLGQHLGQRDRAVPRSGRAVLPVPDASCSGCPSPRRHLPTSRRSVGGVPPRPPLNRRHRPVQACPSSATSSRTSGRLTPTTLWWSPSIPVTKAPPSPSTVNAPATWSGSPVATYAAISSSLTSAKCTVVEAVAAATRSGGGVAQAVPRAEHPGAPAHRAPAADRLRRVLGLAEGLAVELEHRVAAEHQGAGREVVPRRDRSALELGELQRQLGRRQAVHWVSSTPETITTGRCRRCAGWRVGRGRRRRGPVASPSETRLRRQTSDERRFPAEHAR